MVGRDYSVMPGPKPVSPWSRLLFCISSRPYKDIRNENRAIPISRDFFRIFSVSTTDIKTSNIWLVNCSCLAVYCSNVKNEVTLLDRCFVDSALEGTSYVTFTFI